MIEVMALIWFVQQVIKLADARGRSWKPLVALLIVMWLAFEVPVVILLLGNGTGTLGVLAGGLAAGAIGACIPLALAARPAAGRRAPLVNGPG